MYISKDIIMNFFEDINQSEIRYVLIKNIDMELPEKLKDGKDIDILVMEEDKDIFAQYMLSRGFIRQVPPFGVENGWAFAYKLPEYQFWKASSENYDFYIDACFKLCCKSFMPKVWIPLDRVINDDIWKKREWDEEHSWWKMDEKTELIYLLVRSIFDKKEFNDLYIMEIEKRKYLLADMEVVSKLKLIFFKFSECLIAMVQEGKYDDIVQKYVTFTDY